MASSTSLGRVQPLYKGTYSSTTTYQKLDNVYYNGSTWVCIGDNVIGIVPIEGSTYWQKVAGQGATGPQGITGSFGTPTATATELASGSSPTVEVTASGPDTAKVFAFEFGIPAGPKGFQETSATATALAAGSNPTASAELVTSGNTTTLEFEFGIPAADGSGIKSVDGVTADAAGEATLTAVRYGTSQSLSNAQKTQARTNIGAQEAGSYIDDPATKDYGTFLQYAGNVSSPSWVATTINQVPSGGLTSYVLRKQTSTYGWTPVYEVPEGGTSGSVLVKNSGTDYDYGWSPVITESDIDDIVES